MANNGKKNTNRGNVKDNPKSTPKSAPKKRAEGFQASNLWTRVRDYLTGVYNELKKVYWPDRRTLMAYTAVVLVAVAIVSGLLWLFDNAISFLLDLFFKAVA